MRRMHEPLVPAGWLGGARGLGWHIHHKQDVKFISHAGTTNGQQALLLIAPQPRFALAVLTNANRGALLHNQVADWVVERFLGLEPAAPPDPSTVTRDALKQWEGLYAAPGVGMTLHIRLDDAGVPLVDLTPPAPTETSAPQPPRPPARLAPLAPHAFRVDEGWDKGSTGELLRDSSGAIRYLRYAGRILIRAEGA